ncbi:MAG: hypothetical protein NTY31_03350 [Candidatus Falkowbacteria bacterium]|nr:hypothetical protein [Candidatus Falkowbacteria bacterium]
MRKIVIGFLAVIMVSNLFGQTRQEKGQMNALDNEIKRTNREISILENGLLSDKLTSVNKTAILYKIDGRKEKIADLKQERENIFRRYATASDVPKELSRRELNRRQRAYVIRREDLVLQKVEANISSSASPSINPSNSPTTNAGYKIILANDYVLPTLFTISPLNGGDKTSALVDPRQTTEMYLLPGVYEVSFFSGNSFSKETDILKVDGSKRIFRGKEYFGGAYMPRF